MKVARPWFALSFLPLFLVVLTEACTGGSTNPELDGGAPKAPASAGEKHLSKLCYHGVRGRYLRPFTGS